ncbi:preprotein translocase, YajC subunit [Gleimia europaea ACS-120-V-Col10b]|uniref:Preprotein translocase, YajC subunit n=2 Tax=Gleimia TaxID=2692113 RepID=A0A9W5RDF1_9ACTO|nr:preprotein translocase, YajC subunit [Gleimia europaea ACS-120-V-Col10b]
MELMIILLVMLGVMMFMSSRGRKKQQEQLEKMHNEIGIGSWVRTASGYYGIVSDIDGDVYILQSPSGDETYWDRRAIATAAEPPFESTLAGDDEDVDEVGEITAQTEEEEVAQPGIEAAPETPVQEADSDAEDAEDIWDDSFTKSDKPREEN